MKHTGLRHVGPIEIEGFYVRPEQERSWTYSARVVRRRHAKETTTVWLDAGHKTLDRMEAHDPRRVLWRACQVGRVVPIRVRVALE